MRDRDVHLSEAELLLASDGEGSAEQRQHYADCAACRSRARELEGSVALLRENVRLPSHEAARARLLVGLADAAERPATVPVQSRRWQGAVPLAAAAVVCGMAVLVLANRTVDKPSPRLTPGAARAVDRDALCRSELPKNREAPVELRQRVLQAYGIAISDARKYEVDYLITPALGGADDVRNLWPEPFVSTAWNARVKDELEDRLHDLVCGGRLDLAEAQRAIATDWIAAYKKYVRTSSPLQER